MSKEKYLAFVDFISKTVSNEYIYRFDFTDDTDTVWGDFFNIAPTIIVPDLQPEENTISKTARVKIDRKLNIAKKNGCFSMQDCFDKIIALAFTELNEDNTIYYNDEPLYFYFGETFEEVEKKLKCCGYEFFDIVDKEIGNETIIEDLIETITEEKVEKETIQNVFSNYSELLTLKVGEEIERDILNEKLFNAGYERTDYVYKRGQYTIRGHIVDIFSYGHTNPIRISFFGNEIQKIIFFDEYEQSEIETIEEIIIFKKKIFEEDGTGDE